LADSAERQGHTRLSVTELLAAAARLVGAVERSTPFASSDVGAFKR